MNEVVPVKNVPRAFAPLGFGGGELRATKAPLEQNWFLQGGL